jgi:uncharacterized protein involved in outer membrane biogenesis
MKRILLIGIGALVVIIAAVAAFVFFGLGSALKTAIESIGSDATKTTVTLNEADVSVTSAKGTLRGLVVGNPSGFSTPHAFRFDETSVTIDPSSITADTIVIKEIVVLAPEVTYEIGDSGNNIDAIRNNVDAYAKADAGGGSAGAEAGGGKKLIIENLYIRGGKVAVSAKQLQGQSLGAGLPEIHMTDIGKDRGGATPAEVVEEVMASLANSVEGAVGSLDIGGQLKGLLPGAEGLGKGVEGVAGDVGKEAGKGMLPDAGDVGGAVKGVLGQ